MHTRLVKCLNRKQMEDEAEYGRYSTGSSRNKERGCREDLLG
jgi:hypothetical protein